MHNVIMTDTVYNDYGLHTNDLISISTLPKGVKAVCLAMELNQLAEEFSGFYVSHCTKSTRRGNTPVLVRSEATDRSEEIRLWAMMHGMLRGMVGALGATLDIKSLPEEMTDDLRQLETETAIYGYYGGLLRKMHHEKIGPAVLKKTDYEGVHEKFEDGTEYRDLHELCKQLYKQLYIANRHQITNPAGDTLKLLYSHKAEMETLNEITGKVMSRLENGFNTLAEFRLNGWPQPIINRITSADEYEEMGAVTNTAAWLFFAAKAAENLKDDTRRPRAYNSTVTSYVNAAEDVIKKFGAYVLTSPELQNEIIFQPFERAIERMRNSMVTIVPKEMLQNLGADQIFIKKLCTLLDVTPDNYEAILATAKSEKGETASRPEAVSKRSHAGGCPYHGPK